MEAFVTRFEQHFVELNLFINTLCKKISVLIVDKMLLKMGS